MMRVLIADDSVISRHLLDATLRKWGYDVVGAADGNEAWALLNGRNAPSVAILDWMMPGLTGPEVCRRVRQKVGDDYTYVLLLTSKSLKEDLIEGMESGADDYLTKPFDQHELKVRVRAGSRIVQLQKELLVAREALREQATRDSLTRLWNRHTILEMLDREVSRHEREGRALGVVMVDLDRFKQVNDTFGHGGGDTVLKEAAQRMFGAIREYDALGRYGGEEFLLLLSGCDDICAARQAERIRAVLCAQPVMVGNAAYTIRGSFGVSSAVPGGGIAAEDLIRQADEALYCAKANGRNRVEIHRHVQNLTPDIAPERAIVAR